MSAGAAYAIDLDLLDRALEALGAHESACEETLRAVGTEIERLHGSWAGAAATAQAAAQVRWRTGFEDMRVGLARMRAAAEVARDNYGSAVETNVRMWSW